MSSLQLLLLTLMLFLVVVQQTTSESTAQLSEALMKVVGTKHITDQLKIFASQMRDLKGLIDNPNKDNFDQWVVTVPLEISKEADGKLTLRADFTEPTAKEQCYRNRKLKNPLRPQICKNNGCVKNINKLLTKIKTSAELQRDDHIHTEIQVMYRDNGVNIMKDVNNKFKVILMYTYLIPCSQIQNKEGDGVFVECAGEMSNFMVRNNDNENYFIVIYEKAIGERSTVTMSGVSKLYMELGGIPAFHYNHELNTLIRTERILLDFPKDFFIVFPVALQFPRPYTNQRGTLKYTTSQLFIDCIARNDFLNATDDTIGPNEMNRERRKMQFDVMKYFMYKAYGVNDLGAIYGHSKKYAELSKQHCIVEACHYVALEFKDDEKKKSKITSTQQINNYFVTYDGELTNTLDKPSVTVASEQDFCKYYISKAKEYFNAKPPSLESGVCEVKAALPVVAVVSSTGSGKVRREGGGKFNSRNNYRHGGRRGGYRQPSAPRGNQGKKVWKKVSKSTSQTI